MRPPAPHRAGQADRGRTTGWTLIGLTSLIILGLSYLFVSATDLTNAGDTGSQPLRTASTTTGSTHQITNSPPGHID